MNTNLKSALTVAELCGLVAAFAYPVVILSVAAAAAATATAAACTTPDTPRLHPTRQAKSQPPPGPCASIPPAPALLSSLLQLPLQDRSTREAPAGGFSKPSMWGSVDAAAKAKNQQQ